VASANSKPRYFLGLDGGGTKTHCVLHESNSGELRFASGGTTSYENLLGGMQELPDALGQILLPLLNQSGIGIKDIDFAVFGMAGVDTAFQHGLISSVLEAMGFNAFLLSNDAYLGIKAECAGAGICAVNGTGCSVVGISESGEMQQIGGYHDLSGDQGGGAFLGPAAIRASYSQLFKRGRKTLLTEGFYDWLGVNSREGFCEALMKRVLEDKDEAGIRIAKILYGAAEKGDPEALSILASCGRDYALSIRCVAEDLKLDHPVDVVLMGSHFAKCENGAAIEAMEAALNPPGEEEAFRLRKITTLPVAGALLWALELSGVSVNEELREGLRSAILIMGGGEGNA
jgi:N-acetylglucosamine kinase-like BadF-type ATPase